MNDFDRGKWHISRLGGGHCLSTVRTYESAKLQRPLSNGRPLCPRAPAIL